MTAPVAQTGTGNVTSTSSTSAATLTAAKPSNVADGDLLWAVYFARNASGVVTAPSGWTIRKAEAGNGTFAFCTKPIPSASAETATTYAFSVTGGSSRCVLLVGRITGANLNGPADVIGASSVFTGTTSLVHPAITAAFADDLLLTVSTNNNTTGTPSAFTAPTGMTEVAQLSVGNSGTPTATSDVQVAQVALTASGTTGTKTATISPGAANSAGFLVGVAAFPSGAATLAATSSLTAAGSGIYSAAASMSSASAISATAAGQTYTAAATLTSTSSLTADAAPDLVAVMGSDGLWHAVTVYELVSGTWTQ